MYLQHHASQQSTYKAKNVVFYALLVLYTLSVVTIIVEILILFAPVSVDDHGGSILFQLLVQNLHHHVLGIIEITGFACCDFIAQFILVSTTGNAFITSGSSDFLKRYIVAGDRKSVV